MNIKRVVKNACERLLGPRLWRIVRRPMLVPRQYRQIISQTESLVILKEDPKRQDEDYWAHMLRMYAHIIDKGVHRCDWQAGHSGDFYTKAKEALAHIRSSVLREDPSIAWALRTLEEYERRQHEGTDTLLQQQRTPAPNEYECLIGAIKERRSIRTYANRPIDAATIRKIVEAVNWAPSSCNRQTTRVFVGLSSDVIASCLATCAGATCFGGTIAAFFAFCFDARCYDFPEELFVPHIDVGLGVQNCCLVAWSLGVSITLLSWARRTPTNEKDLRRLLRIPDYCQVVVAGVAGYPRYATPIPGRKSVEETLSII